MNIGRAVGEGLGTLCKWELNYIQYWLLIASHIKKMFKDAKRTCESLLTKIFERNTHCHILFRPEKGAKLLLYFSIAPNGGLTLLK